MKRVRATVHGRVQGVMFRDSCRDEAERLALVGWVRNEPDGSVGLEAEGQPEAVEDLLRWCRSGPPAARVERVDSDDVDVAGGTRFEVRW